MKDWFRSIQASFEMDSGNRQGTRTEAGHRGHIFRVHEELKSSKPQIEAPANLHTYIMRAVQKRASAPGWTGMSAVPYRVAVACALLLLAGAVVWTNLSGPDPRGGRGLASAQPAIDLVDRATAQLQALTGLDQEMQRLDHDLRATAEHFLASVP